jgi:hypothetical protein
MKTGAVASPWRYDAALNIALSSPIIHSTGQ